MTALNPELAGILRNMDSRISNLEGRVSEQSSAIAELGRRIDTLHSRIDRLFYAIVGFGIAVVAALGGGLITMILRGVGGG